jgi:hypothetical protein
MSFNEAEAEMASKQEVQAAKKAKIKERKRAGRQVSPRDRHHIVLNTCAEAREG